MPTKLPAETPAEGEILRSIIVDVSPNSISANTGDEINLKLKFDWEPEDWKGPINVTLVISAAGFEKK